MNQSEHQKRWYEKHKARHIANVARRNRGVREVMTGKLLEYLRNHPCVDCGESDPIVLEFDHVSGEKFDNISTMISTYRHSWASIQHEIAKCEVRCANCHRRQTARRGNWRMWALTRSASEAEASTGNETATAVEPTPVNPLKRYAP